MSDQGKGEDNPAFIKSHEDLSKVNQTSDDNNNNETDQSDLNLSPSTCPKISPKIETFERLSRSQSTGDVNCQGRFQTTKLPSDFNDKLTKVNQSDNVTININNNNNVTATECKQHLMPIEPSIKPKPELLNAGKTPRKGSGIAWGPVYTVPVFARNFRTSSFESVTTGSDVEMTGHRRRASANDYPNGHNGSGPGGIGGVGCGAKAADGDHSRRKSVRTIIFGDPMSRRFSQDLWHLCGPEDNDPHADSETTKVIFFQVFIPFLIAGFGNVGAGLILDYVQTWEVFRNVSGLFVLVASFLGFKGNLEMTLAARLSTQANLGKMDLFKEQCQVAIGNIALVQCQAVAVAFIASFIAIASASLPTMTFDLSKSLILITTSLVTASITGLFLAALMVTVVIISRKTNVNPDNVSTLIAAFLGDLTAVCFIAGSSWFFYTYYSIGLSIGVILFFIVIQFLCTWIAMNNDSTRPVIGTGWTAIIIAMIISSLGGFIFDYAVERFRNIALFQPIINGTGANLVAVQASRISTFFHRRSNLGEFPTTEDGEKMKICECPHRAFFGSNPNAKTARLLLLMVIPGHIIYIVTLKLILPRLIWITGPFLLSFMVVAMVQVIILLYIAHVTVPLLWKFKYDPDNNAIPSLMSLGDLFGTALFTTAYVILSLIGDPNGLVNE